MLKVPAPESRGEKVYAVALIWEVAGPTTEAEAPVPGCGATANVAAESNLQNPLGNPEIATDGYCGALTVVVLKELLTQP